MQALLSQDFALDKAKHEACRSGTGIPLSRKEYDLLEFFARNQGRVINRLTILEYVWNYNAQIATNTLEVHMAALRRKLDDKYTKKLIHTIHGVGYMFGYQD
jgi:DNA-binding response OmpR family regulator